MNKQGFGILEVLVAAVVLGFMIIGLNTLQKGNREGVLRVRARDVANSIAQSTIDSITALGSASVDFVDRSCDEDENRDLCKTRSFSGKGVGEVEIPYKVNVKVKEGGGVIDNSTNYTRANSTFQIKENLAKHIEVTVSWKFKNSDQSINVSTVIR